MNSPDFSKVLLPMIRRIMPSTIVHDIVGVQPMTAPQGHVFSMRTNYGPHKCEFCGQNDCIVRQCVYPLHTNSYPIMSDTERKEYSIFIYPSRLIIESYLNNILISEYDYEFGKMNDYFGIRNEDYDPPEIFKQKLLAVHHDLNDETISYITKDSLAIHGVYFQ